MSSFRRWTQRKIRGGRGSKKRRLVCGGISGSTLDNRICPERTGNRWLVTMGAIRIDGRALICEKRTKKERPSILKTISRNSALISYACYTATLICNFFAALPNFNSLSSMGNDHSLHFPVSGYKPINSSSHTLVPCISKQSLHNRGYLLRNGENGNALRG